jgi:hypothetical protein
MGSFDCPQPLRGIGGSELVKKSHERTKTPPTGVRPSAAGPYDHDRAVRNEAFTVRNEAFTVRNEAFTVQNEAFTVQNEAFMVQNEAFTVRNEAFMVRNEAFVLQNVASRVRVPRSPLVVIGPSTVLNPFGLSAAQHESRGSKSVVTDHGSIQCVHRAIHLRSVASTSLASARRSSRSSTPPSTRHIDVIRSSAWYLGKVAPRKSSGVDEIGSTPTPRPGNPATGNPATDHEARTSAPQ